MFLLVISGTIERVSKFDLTSILVLKSKATKVMKSAQNCAQTQRKQCSKSKVLLNKMIFQIRHFISIVDWLSLYHQYFCWNGQKVYKKTRKRSILKACSHQAANLQQTFAFQIIRNCSSSVVMHCKFAAECG